MPQPEPSRRRFLRFVSLSPRQWWQAYLAWWRQDSVWWGVSFMAHSLALVLLGLAVTVLARPSAAITQVIESFDERAFEAAEAGVAIDLDLPVTGGDGGTLQTVEDIAPEEAAEEADSAGGGMFASTDQPLYGGLGGFDVSTPELGPAIDGAGGVGAGIGAGINPGHGGDGSGMGGGPGSRFFGIAGKGRTFIYVFDCSESMLNANRFERAKTELLSSISRLSPEQRFFVILFNDNALPMDADAPVPATSQEIAKLREWLEDIAPSTGTNPLPALLFGLGLDPDAMYFLSDGEFDPNAIYELRAKNRGSSRRRKAVPIHAISLSSVGAENLMKIIARTSGGKYRFVQ